MSSLAVFLILIVSLTALLVASLTKQFQEENLIYSNKNQMTNSNTKTKTIEKEKVVAETLNGRFCLLYTSPSPRDRQKSRMPSSA